MTWHQKPHEGLRVVIICRLVKLGVFVSPRRREEVSMVIKGECFVFLAEEGGYGERPTLVDLGCVEGDGEI